MCTFFTSTIFKSLLLSFLGLALVLPTSHASAATMDDLMLALRGLHETFNQRESAQGKVLGVDTQADNSISVEDVTIYFTGGTQTGSFISGNLGNGDPWVVGPIVVIGWTPAPGTVTSDGTSYVVNGAEIHPSATENGSGFDSRHRNQAADAHTWFTQTIDKNNVTALRLTVYGTAGSGKVQAQECAAYGSRIEAQEKNRRTRSVGKTSRNTYRRL